jgi:hypothetical protein
VLDLILLYVAQHTTERDGTCDLVKPKSFPLSGVGERVTLNGWALLQKCLNRGELFLKKLQFDSEKWSILPKIIAITLTPG